MAMFPKVAEPKSGVHLTLDGSVEDIYVSLREALARGELRLYLDIDGTLSNFTKEKMDALVNPQIVDLIYQCEFNRPGTVVFVTGRPRPEVLQLFKLSTGEDLFEKLKLEGKAEPSMICNHGRVAYIQGELSDEFEISMQEQAFIETVKQDALERVNQLIEESGLRNFIEKVETNADGVSVTPLSKFISQTDIKEGKLAGLVFEIKYDRANLASFGFHWRILDSMIKLAEGDDKKALEAILKKFADMIAKFGDEYNEHEDNPIRDVREGEHQGKPFRLFGQSNNSSMVVEFGIRDEHLNKGTMVLRCLETFEEGLQMPVRLAMGDSIPGTDEGLLNVIRDRTDSPGHTFVVRHAGSKKPHSAAEKNGYTGFLQADSQEIEGGSLRFLLEAGLHDSLEQKPAHRA